MTERLIGSDVEPGSEAFLDGYIDALLVERPEAAAAIEALRNVDPEIVATALVHAYWLVADAAALSRTNLERAEVSRDHINVREQGTRAGAHEVKNTILRLIGASDEGNDAEQVFFEQQHEREVALKEMGR